MKNTKVKFAAIVAIVMLAAASLGASPQTLPVPAETRLVVRLDTGISSKTSSAGDRFTATVVSPRAYTGAIVRGHIADLKESGRLKGKTEMVLDFDSIELRDGRTSALKAELDEIRQSESVKVVDEEGNIQTGGRGKQAIKRGAIGAAIGGVLGGLIGGGKGAVVGILVGGGAGAGSLVIDGKKELKLESGTEMILNTLRTPGRATVSEGLPLTRKLIMDVQRALNREGYNAGAADGSMGPATRKALRRFQRDNALPVTGQIDRETAQRLGITLDN